MLQEIDTVDAGHGLQCLHKGRAVDVGPQGDGRGVVGADFSVGMDLEILDGHAVVLAVAQHGLKRGLVVVQEFHHELGVRADALAELLFAAAAGIISGGANRKNRSYDALLRSGGGCGKEALTKERALAVSALLLSILFTLVYLCWRVCYSVPTGYGVLPVAANVLLLALAEEMGVGYFDRPDNKGAKAGNLNHALALTGACLQRQGS